MQLQLPVARQGSWRCHLPVAHRLPRPSRLRARYATTSANKDFDVVGLNNLCVDIVIPVEELPVCDQQLLARLSANPPSKDSWEVGGNCNFLIAAARLGMRVGTAGHIGSDVYGSFMESVLQAERIPGVNRIASPHQPGTSLDHTLLCFVLVDPDGRHAFCSRYDWGPWPLLEGVERLPPSVASLLGRTRAVFTNGFVFDELPLELIQSAARQASSAGAAVFFDPGPRCFTMRTGSRRAALDAVLDLSDVVLMTMEEAREVTGHDDPAAAASLILSRPGAKTEWCVVKLGSQGALLMTKSAPGALSAKAIKVEVKDTVGCGDSFAAAVVLGYIRCHDLPSTLVLANAVGAATAMGRGAGTHVAAPDQVLALLRGALAAGDHSPADVSRAIALLQDSLEGAGRAAALR